MYTDKKRTSIKSNDIWYHMKKELSKKKGIDKKMKTLRKTKMRSMRIL